MPRTSSRIHSKQSAGTPPISTTTSSSTSNKSSHPSVAKKRPRSSNNTSSNDGPTKKTNKQIKQSLIDDIGRACINNDTVQLNQLLQNHCTDIYRNSDGPSKCNCTSIKQHNACSINLEQTVSHELSPDTELRYGYTKSGTPFLLCIINDSTQCLQLLLDLQIDLLQLSDPFVPVLPCAARNKSINSLILLLDTLLQSQLTEQQLIDILCVNDITAASFVHYLSRADFHECLLYTIQRLTKSDQITQDDIFYKVLVKSDLSPQSLLKYCVEHGSINCIRILLQYSLHSVENIFDHLVPLTDAIKQLHKYAKIYDERAFVSDQPNTVIFNHELHNAAYNMAVNTSVDSVPSENQSKLIERYAIMLMFLRYETCIESATERSHWASDYCVAICIKHYGVGAVVDDLYKRSTDIYEVIYRDIITLMLCFDIIISEEQFNISTAVKLVELQLQLLPAIGDKPSVVKLQTILTNDLQYNKFWSIPQIIQLLTAFITRCMTTVLFHLNEHRPAESICIELLLPCYLQYIVKSNLHHTQPDLHKQFDDIWPQLDVVLNLMNSKYADTSMSTSHLNILIYARYVWYQVFNNIDQSQYDHTNLLYNMSVDNNHIIKQLHRTLKCNVELLLSKCSLSNNACEATKQSDVVVPTSPQQSQAANIVSSVHNQSTNQFIDRSLQSYHTLIVAEMNSTTLQWIQSHQQSIKLIWEQADRQGRNNLLFLYGLNDIVDSVDTVDLLISNVRYLGGNVSGASVYINRLGITDISYNSYSELDDEVDDMVSDDESMDRDICPDCGEIHSRCIMSDIQIGSPIDSVTTAPAYIQLNSDGRTNVLQSFMRQILAFSVTRLQSGLSVRYANEFAVGTGPTCECLHYISNIIFYDETYFIHTPNLYSIHTAPVPSTIDIQPHKPYYQMVGRLLALCVLNRVSVGIHINRAIIRQIIGSRSSSSLYDNMLDLYDYDTQLFHTFSNMIQSTTDRVQSNQQLIDLDIPYTIDITNNDKIDTVELCKNGNNINVTDSTLLQYINDYINQLLYHGQQQELIDCIVDEFISVIPRSTMTCISVDQLQSLLMGKQTIDIDDARRYIQIGHGYTIKSEQVKWFFNWLDHIKCDTHKVSQLLLFWSGVAACSTFNPINDTIPYIIELYSTDDDTSNDSLCTSATCNKILRIPAYSTEDILRYKLEQSIAFGSVGFAMA